MSITSGYSFPGPQGAELLQVRGDRELCPTESAPLHGQDICTDISNLLCSLASKTCVAQSCQTCHREVRTSDPAPAKSAAIESSRFHGVTVARKPQENVDVCRFVVVNHKGCTSRLTSCFHVQLRDTSPDMLSTAPRAVLGT